ncbi:MAG: arsenate reductase (glutaredoxin) [Ruegeria sp.]
MIEYWHNPRCSKSRAGLALLQERGAEVRVRRYLEDVPNVEELKSALSALGIPAVKLMRTGEAVFKELELSKSDSDQTLIAAMAAHPILIERPIAMANGKAAIGRPPENLLELL